VRFTLKTWNLTTHKIDPDVDEARDYLLDDLMETGRVSLVAYLAGVQPAERTAPRRNLTGDFYFTNGLRRRCRFLGRPDDSDLRQLGLKTTRCTEATEGGLVGEMAGYRGGLVRCEEQVGG
jgi:hypothetical protein